MSYIDGFVVPVPEDNQQAYLEMARKAAKVFIKHGANRVVEAWDDDLTPGKINDFRTAVLAEESEKIVFSWLEWPSKEARNEGMQKAMVDPDMPPSDNLPFTGKHLIWGGFTTILDSNNRGK